MRPVSGVKSGRKARQTWAAPSRCIILKYHRAAHLQRATVVDVDRLLRLFRARELIVIDVDAGIVDQSIDSALFLLHPLDQGIDA